MSSESGSSPPPSVPSTSKDTKEGSTMTRIQRNVAEKQRRDKLNGYISELASIVPMVSQAPKRLDKTSILRLSAAHLRICKSPLGSNKKTKKSFKWCPSFLNSGQGRALLECVDGFLMVTTANGKILLVSRTVEQYIGHQHIDMIGHSLLNFVHPDDSDLVKDEMEKLLLASVQNTDGCAPRTSFHCRLREKGQPRSEVVTYQNVHISGDLTATESNTKSLKSVVSHMFNAWVKIVEMNPYNHISIEEAMADEYVTRHSLDGTIIFTDHRISSITGHMPNEVVGLSAYCYIHQDDLKLTQFAQSLMFDNDKGTGIIVYRLRTRDEKHVYLKSVGFLQFDSSSKIDHFVCVNQYLSESEGAAQLKFFHDRFLPHIKDGSINAFFEKVKSMQKQNGGAIAAQDAAPNSPAIKVESDAYPISYNDPMLAPLRSLPEPRDGSGGSPDHRLPLQDGGARQNTGGSSSPALSPQSMDDTSSSTTRTKMDAAEFLPGSNFDASASRLSPEAPPDNCDSSSAQQPVIVVSSMEVEQTNAGVACSNGGLSGSPSGPASIAHHPSMAREMVYYSLTSPCSSSSVSAENSDDTVENNPVLLAAESDSSLGHSPLMASGGVLKGVLQWPLKNNNHLMECGEDSLNSEKMLFTEDLCSLLSATMPKGGEDEGSLPPSANGWGDIMCAAEYSMPFGSDFLSRDDEDS